MWAIVKPHLIYWVLIAVGLVGFRSWLIEHDNRLLATAETQAIKTQVTQLQADKTQLQDAIKQISATSAATIAALKLQATKITTPQQAVIAIPDVSQLPIHSRPAVDNAMQVSVDAVPLYQELNQCRQDQVALGACQAIHDKDQQLILNSGNLVKLKDEEIAVLKKPQGFWKRFTGTIKQVGIGIGIGIALGHKF